MALNDCCPPLHDRVPYFPSLCAALFVREKGSTLGVIGIADDLSFSIVTLSTTPSVPVFFLLKLSIEQGFVFFNWTQKGHFVCSPLFRKPKKKRKTIGVSGLCDVSTHPPLKIE